MKNRVINRQVFFLFEGIGPTGYFKVFNLLKIAILT
jgi:hypothetical protein